MASTLPSNHLLNESFSMESIRGKDDSYPVSPDILAETFIHYTERYRQFTEDETELREVSCYRILLKAMVCGIKEGDLFAGRMQQPAIGFIPQSDEGSLGYYFHPEAFEKLLNDKHLNVEYKKQLETIAGFWKTNTTVYKTKQAYPPEMKTVLPSDSYCTESGIAFTLWRMSGVQMDYAKLVSLGIPGLRSEIKACQQGVEKGSRPYKLYAAMEMALDTFSEVCLFYASGLKELIQSSMNQDEKKELVEMERILRKLTVEKPESFWEGLQLVFLYTTLDGARNYGRLDDALGDLYTIDLLNNKITEEEAIRLLSSLWKLISDRNYRYDSRIIIGGKGRNHEANADKLALAIMETTRRVKDIVPQLALRFYAGQDPELYQKALDIIGEGNPFPMLYNDDVNIPSACKAFDIPYEVAVHLIQYGCGEYVLNHRSVGTPSAVINLLQALLVTLHKGIDPVTKKRMGMPAGRYAKYGNFDMFEQLWAAYKEQVEYHIDQLSKHEELEYTFAGKDAPYLYTSILMDDCIKRGKGIYSGGIRYLGGTLESYGNSNTADSLTALKRMVYEQKSLTLHEVIEVLDADFNNSEKERKLMLDCPKYGNDNETADNMLVQVHNHVCNYTKDQKNKTGLHSYLVVVINNDANTVMGENTPASPDGRKAFDFLNPGNAPSGGADKNGATAFLNSIVKPDSSIHAGAVQNMKFSKEMFSHNRDKMEILLATYWQKGGTQAMLSVVGRGDLEAAMKNPENYQNLLVRVGGFSERFVNLPVHTQLEVLSRTMY